MVKLLGKIVLLLLFLGIILGAYFFLFKTSPFNEGKAQIAEIMAKYNVSFDSFKGGKMIELTDNDALGGIITKENAQNLKGELVFFGESSNCDDAGGDKRLCSFVGLYIEALDLEIKRAEFYESLILFREKNYETGCSALPKSEDLELRQAEIMADSLSLASSNLAYATEFGEQSVLLDINASEQIQVFDAFTELAELVRNLCNAEVAA